MVKLPAVKSPFPAAGETWRWRRRYFDLGDRIVWRGWSDKRNHQGIVTAIKVNKSQRVSYYSGDHFILLEDVARVAADEPVGQTKA